MNSLPIIQQILPTLKARSIRHVEELQTLWSGYGTIERLTLEGGKYQTVILKHIKLDEAKQRDVADSYQRKHKSYLVETAWYKNYSMMCDNSCRVPKYLASTVTKDTLFIVLEDLDAAGFPLRRSHLSREELDACLFWLANFHATFLSSSAEALWEIGTYWHLKTRYAELNAMPKGALKKKAHKLDEKLNSAQFQTLVHGDAKPENFCFSKDGFTAAVDFQYVGRGCGIKDVAYFLWGLSPKQATKMLDLYFEHLGAAVKCRRPDLRFDAVRDEWESLFPVACDDFERFLQGWFVLRR